ncbi:ABC transporter ATP-binding protein [Jiangella mangrovi]|uniref:Branched-chain amino acid transport system ATP-binding protein n=1 Tax=Jiangella mangrovi TaxID=1524084 RepID=A0A7W9GSN5_9ACTN|nr:ABC transporter ATP-binding protein [Jiangella mangrovi]MBB5789333.1 branched-chain amino acid transport system ATP-binding protein [Jiangella mangrovi]
MSILEIHELSCRFGGLWANRDISFEVPDHSIVGLIGPNGAGKSTLFSMIAGAQQPTSGKLVFAGRDVTGWSPHQAARAGVGRTFQLMRVFSSMTVAENVATAALVRHRSTREARRAADEVLERLGLGPVAHTQASSLTAAGKKRLEMARALAIRPKLLLLDEVLSGLTPTEANEAVEIVRSLRRDDVTVVMVEHVMEIIMPLCDRVVVLHHGQKLFEGAPHDVVRDAAVVDAYLGEAV